MPLSRPAAYLSVIWNGFDALRLVWYGSKNIDPKSKGKKILIIL